MAAAKTETTSHTKPKLQAQPRPKPRSPKASKPRFLSFETGAFRAFQERRPGFRSEPLTLQPGLKFYSPPAGGPRGRRLIQRLREAEGCGVW